ncbi:MAG TPA: hypothetical protein VF789_20595 [Thermoanaerobaculia bacterium]
MRRTILLLALAATLAASLALGASVSPVNAATCAPSPLCPGSACDADCKSRGARFGFCTAEQCCACIWKI